MIVTITHPSEFSQVSLTGVLFASLVKVRYPLLMMNTSRAISAGMPIMYAIRSKMASNILMSRNITDCLSVDYVYETSPRGGSGALSTRASESQTLTMTAGLVDGAGLAKVDIELTDMLYTYITIQH